MAILAGFGDGIAATRERKLVFGDLLQDIVVKRLMLALGTPFGDRKSAFVGTSPIIKTVCDILLQTPRTTRLQSEA